MSRILWVVALAACEGGQSPSSENIRIAALDCMHGSDLVEFEAFVEVTLADGESVRVTFLPAVDDVQFSRTTTWNCFAWSEVAGADGCARDSGQPEETQTVSVNELNSVNIGMLPSTFEYTTIVSITNLEGADVESVLLTDDCN